MEKDQGCKILDVRIGI